MRRTLLAAVLSAALGAAHAQGAKESLPLGTPIEAIKPGEWIWYAEAAPEGPMLLVVSIAQQKAYLYRNGVRVGVTSVSTGKKGHETPTGVFTILQKNKDHRSNLYDDAPMPYMQRLTWDGVALHSGRDPGYPASHGCIRMPDGFAKRLFAETSLGMTVVVTRDVEAVPENVVDPKVLVQPMDAKGRPVQAPSLSLFEAYRWQPEKSEFGPMTVLVSTKDQRVIVLRNGIEIGRAKIGIVGDAPFGNQAYVVLDGDAGTPSRLVPDLPALNWLAIPLPGSDAPAGSPAKGLDYEAVARIALPVDFAKLVYRELKPGSTLLLTDEHLSRANDGKGMTVLSDESDDSHFDGPTR